MAITADPVEATAAVTRAFNEMLSEADHGIPMESAQLRPQLLAATRDVAVSALRHGGSARAVADSRSGRGSDLSARVAAAFRRLPERWRSVLWLVEVERIPIAEAARIIGVATEDVAALTVRAWAGLRDLALAGHGQTGPACGPIADRLTEHFCGTLTGAERNAVKTHLGGCAHCRAQLDELHEMALTLRQVVVPLPAGLLAAAAPTWQEAKPVARPRSARAPGEAGKTLVRIWLATLGLGIIGVAVLDQSSAPILPSATVAAPVLSQASPAEVQQVLAAPPTSPGGTIASASTSAPASTFAGAGAGSAASSQSALRSQAGQGHAGSATAGPVTADPSASVPSPAASSQPVLILPVPAATQPSQVLGIDTGLLGIPVAINIGTCTGLQVAILSIGCTG